MFCVILIIGRKKASAGKREMLENNISFHKVGKTRKNRAEKP